MNTFRYLAPARISLLPGALFALLLVAVGCKPVFTFKKTFHGLYTNHQPNRIFMDDKRLEFLPEHHFVYESDDGCTLNHKRGIGTYHVKRNRVLLRFEHHPEDQRQNFRLTSLAPTIKDSLTVTCTLNPAFMQKQLLEDSAEVKAIFEFRCGGDYHARNKTGTATFLVPKNHLSPWGQLEITLTTGRHEWPGALLAFPVKDSSIAVYVNGMNPKNMHYLEAGESMSLPIRHRFPGGFLVGPFRKKRER